MQGFAGARGVWVGWTRWARLGLVAVTLQFWPARTEGESNGHRGQIKPKVIYGPDDRRDWYQEDREDRRRWAASVCAIVESSKLVADPGGEGFLLTTDPFAIGPYRPCAGEPYRDQPLAASCTAFLVAPDVVATAGHCLANECELANFRFVFGFAMTAPGTVTTNFPADHVYRGVELLGRTLADGLDYAVVRLDRTVTAPDAAPLEVRNEGRVADQASLGVIGHPVGLPLKLAFGDTTRVASNLDPVTFAANLDAYGGNSGSPVFNAASGLVEGILVSGPRYSFELAAGGCFKSIVYDDSQAVGFGINVVRSPLIPWNRILEAVAPPNDALAEATPINGAQIEAFGANYHATSEPGEPIHGGPGGKSVWWRWTAPRGGTTSLTTAGTKFSTRLAVYEGASLAALTRVAVAVNTSGLGTSFLLFNAEAGKTYSIAVDGSCGEVGEIRLGLKLAEPTGAVFADSRSITLPGVGPAAPFPSLIDVQGLTGVLTRVRVTLRGYHHNRAPWTHAVVVSPQGQSVRLTHGGGWTANGPVTITFDDAAATPLPDGFNTKVSFQDGSYRPGWFGVDSELPKPGPPLPYESKLAALTGSDPNGNWQLYVNQGFVRGAEDGTVAGGWSLELDSAPNSPPIIGYVADQVFADAAAAQPVDLLISDAESAVQTLRFSIASSNPAIFTAEQMAVLGTGNRRRLLLAPTGAAGQSEITVRVADPSGEEAVRTFRVAILAAGNPRFANFNGIRIPAWGAAEPFPSAIQVQGLNGMIRQVRVTLAGYQHNKAPWTDAVLVSPEGQAVRLMHGGGWTSAGPVLLTFDDDASTPLPNGFTSSTQFKDGSYRTGYFGGADDLPAPAPPGPYGTNLAAFKQTTPNGTWRLYLNQGFNWEGQGGEVAAGWLIDIATLEPPLRLTAELVPHSRDIRLSWDCQPGRRYRVEHQTDLGASAWTSLHEFTAAASRESHTSTLPGDGQGFFRVVSSD